MAKQLILRGRVQGVFCRNYCTKYGRKLGINGSASNLRDGSVRVVLNTEDENVIQNYINALKNNPLGISFFGRIEEIEINSYVGSIGGDYVF